MLKLIPRNPFPHTFVDILTASSSVDRNQFYSNLLNYLDVKDGILVGSGREALYLILKSLLKEGDEVIVPAFSCNVIIGAIKKSGVQPVFSDVCIDSLNMNLENIMPLVTVKTKAVLVTHQFGYPADIDEITDFCKKKDILVIEDAAPAFGAQYKDKLVGIIGDVGFYSFQESKVISTINGGFIVGKNGILNNIRKTFHYTGSSKLNCFIPAMKSLVLQNSYIYSLVLNMYGIIYKSYFHVSELNMELDRYTLEYKGLSRFQRNLGNLQLKNLKEILETRSKTAHLYKKVLADCSQIIKIPQDDLSIKTHAYSRFPILVKDKLPFYNKVRKTGVDLGFTFSYKLPQYFKDDNNRYPNTDFIINHILNVPITRFPSTNKKIMIKLSNL